MNTSYRILGVALLLVLFLVPFGGSSAVTTRPDLRVTTVFWGSTQAPIAVQPGDQDQALIITISNVGNNVAYSATASLKLDYPFSYPLAEPGQNQTIQVQLGVMQILSSLPTRFVLDIDPLAKNGIYRLNLELSYSDAANGGYYYDETTVIDIPVTGYTSLTVSKAFWGSSTVPIEVQPGDSNQPLTIVIANSGTATASNVTASLIIESPFSYQYYSDGYTIEAANETSSVGSIMPGGSGLAQFTLSVGASATTGLYRLRMRLNYMRNPSIQTSVDIPVRGFSDLALQKVSVSPTKVYPGDKNVDLKVFITNAGNAAAKNVSVEIVQAQFVRPSWGGADSSFIGSVQPGQVVPVDFYIDVDESAPSPRNYTLIAKMIYGPERNLEKLEDVPLFLSAEARFVVTSTKIPEIHTSDTGLVILITFKNNGTEAAQGTRVEIETPNVFSGTTSDYIGTVEAGQEKTASFVLDVDANAKTGPYVLTQRLSWSQTGATELFTQDLSLELNVLENPFSNLLPAMIVIVLIIVALAVVVNVVRSRSAQMRPKQT